MSGPMRGLSFGEVKPWLTATSMKNTTISMHDTWEEQALGEKRSGLAIAMGIYHYHKYESFEHSAGPKNVERVAKAAVEAGAARQ